jgi:hypothetical protein
MAAPTLMVAVVSSLAMFPAGLRAQQETVIEEVIVTGSFIRRADSFDLVSPLNVTSSEDIAEHGTPNLGEIIRRQPFNFGDGGPRTIRRQCGDPPRGRQ